MIKINKNQSHLVIFVKLEYVRQTLAHPIIFSSSTIISCFTFTSSSSSDPTPLTELSYNMFTDHNNMYPKKFFLKKMYPNISVMISEN